MTKRTQFLAAQRLTHVGQPAAVKKHDPAPPDMFLRAVTVRCNRLKPGSVRRFKVSRASLVETYIAALPFAAVAIVPIAGGCRVEIGGPSKPAFFFKLTHIELVLSDDVAASPDIWLVALATLTLLTAGANHKPILLAADDAQWLDGATRDVLSFVSRRLGS